MNYEDKEHYYFIENNNGNVMGSKIDKDKDKDCYSVYEKYERHPSETTTVGDNEKNKKRVKGNRYKVSISRTVFNIKTLFQT